MAAVKKKGLSDEEIGLIVDRKVRLAVGVGSSKLAKEREKITKYYNGEAPAPQHKGQSTYVSSDVYDAVEAMKADLLETFGGSQRIGQFEPEGPGDAEACRIATDYVSYLIYRKNPGWAVFHDIVDDGLKSRVGVVKIYWDEDKEYEDEEFEGLDEMTVQGLVAQEDVEELEAEPDEFGVYSGTLTRVKRNKSQVRIEAVAPENFGVEPQAKRLEDSFHHHWELMTKDEMEAMGLDTSKLKDVNPDADENIDTSTETEARFEQIDTGYSPSDDEDQETLKKYKVYECYVRLRKTPQDRIRLYRVIRVANVTLECTEVDRSPFKVFVPLRVAHSFWGNSFANRVVQTQNARTVLTRGILDHTVITLNPRYTVLQGGLTNPREMIDGRIGGLVNITRPDAVQPLMQANLNPFVYQTIEMLKQNKEETTGTSSLAQGLNKDAISNQNSQGMIQDLVDLSKQRAKVVARNFAEFLREVYEEVYRLVIENEDRQEIVELAGNWVEIDPKRWSERKAFRLNFHLGKAANEAEAMKYVSLLTLAGQDPELARMIGSKGKYNVATKVMTINDIPNHADFITPPDQIPPPEPPPEVMLKMKELELKNLELEDRKQEREVNSQLEMARLQHEQAMKALELQDRELEIKLKLAESHRKDMQIANEIDISQREMTIAEQTPMEPGKAIVSPNS